MVHQPSFCAYSITVIRFIIAGIWTGGNLMQENSGKFSMEEAMRLAQSPAGQQLLALLQQNNSKNL